MKPTITALAPWYGSNRTLAHLPGAMLAGCQWVGVPFAGGMCELGHIKARTVLVSDLHRHLINLARVIADDALRAELVRKLRRAVFHPDELDNAQERAKIANLCDPSRPPRVDFAYDYFVCVWMGRSHIAGTADEFHGRLSTRWNANGGDSNRRFRSAVRSLAAFGLTARRCSFSVMDAFTFLERCEDRDRHGIYCDPPFPGPGDRYRHGLTELQQRQLAERLQSFRQTRVVVRYYEHPLIEELYSAWHWHRPPGGRTQANAPAPEVLLTNWHYAG